MRRLAVCLLLALVILPLFAEAEIIPLNSKQITNDLHTWERYKTLPYDVFLTTQNIFGLNNFRWTGGMQLIDQNQKVYWTKQGLSRLSDRITCIIDDDYNMRDCAEIGVDGSAALIRSKLDRTVIINKSGQEYPLPLHTGNLLCLGQQDGKYWIFEELSMDKFDLWGKALKDTLYFEGRNGILVTDTVGVVLNRIILPDAHQWVSGFSLDKKMRFAAYSFDDYDQTSGHALITTDGKEILKTQDKTRLLSWVSPVFSNDGELCMYRGEKSCKIIETTSGNCIFSLGKAGFLSYLSDKKYGMMATFNKNTVYIIDYVHLKCLGKITIHPNETLEELWMSPNGKEIRITTQSNKYSVKEVDYYRMLSNLPKYPY